MAGYISYCTFTQEGLKNLKKAPDVIKQAKANLEKMGVKTVGVWSTFAHPMRVVDSNIYAVDGVRFGLTPVFCWLPEKTTKIGVLADAVSLSQCYTCHPRNFLS